MTILKEILEKKNICKSIWFMRQAGRYLPEFREIRKKNPDFIKLCLNSELSSKITLHPIKRFNLDSAIIFSDILIVPYSLGQNVKFIKESGPKLSNFNIECFLDVTENQFSKTLSPVYKSIEITRRKLDKKKSLISFIGAPWTLFIYMLNIKKENNKEVDITKLKKEKITINKILKKMITFLCVHIKNQIDAGADIVQIFDSWAGLVPVEDINEYCYVPNLKIVDFCKKKKIPNICFPRGIKEKYYKFNNIVKPDGINIDYEVDPDWARNNLRNVVIQGGLDPKKLLTSEGEMLEGATKYIRAFKGIPYIFNLGHGLLPETDPDRVKKLVEFYRNFNE